MNDEPTYESEDFIGWKNSVGEFHREGDLPAKIFKSDGMKIYMINGKLHRELGPAIEKKNFAMYFLNGVEVTDKKEMRKIQLRGRFKKLNSPH